MKETIELLSPLYKKGSDEWQDVTISLFTSLHTTGESILSLLYHGTGIWDADILLRTVMEGTIKYCFLISGNDEQRKLNYEEYKIHLTEIQKISDHNKAKRSISILKEFSTNSTKTIELSLLSRQELDNLNEKYPKEYQRKINRKWSYQYLLKDMASKNKEYESQLASLYAYSFSSHLIHYDWTGLSMRQQQISSSYFEAEKNGELNLGHAVRIISNLLVLYSYRVSEYCQCYEISSKDIAELTLALLDYASELIEVGNEIINKYV
ncbi:DUF5677 domain-containing protein [Candidatus Enterococcus murrayae]|uniref:Uncharacterized protein n=1 Tax=Candidatus Enterococcus murrayae TaxID=2815321 RepID=A0ABS3HD14_9ENTE|nr:DUF5677 domain-containing protein [Enterococcus sp. MJM16]MBO0451336.1 hypothetical protein [Enterococcus sp. MJM16]